MTIEKHIAELLFEHDCVIIPQFGGFVGNYKPSKLDAVQNKFTPPSKEIGFNKNLNHNDGLLANRISQKENKSYDEANLLVKKFSDELKHNLRQRKKIELPQIGTLFADEVHNIQFEPDYSSNFLIDSFGLRQFHTTVLKKTIQKPQFAPIPKLQTPKETESGIPLREKAAPLVFKDRIPEIPKQKISARKIKKYIAYSAAVLPLLLLLLWIPFNLEKINFIGQKAKSLNYSNLISFAEKANAVYVERKEMMDVGRWSAPNAFGDGFRHSAEKMGEERNLLSEISDTISFAEISLLDEDKKIVVRLKNIVNEQQTTSNKQRTKFHIIAGCFEFFENAEKLVKSLRKQGFEPQIIDKHKGLYRVSIRSFPSRKNAVEELAQIKTNYNPSVWLLVK